jgi:hypothetical protein
MVSYGDVDGFADIATGRAIGSYRRVSGCQASCKLEGA